MAKEYISPDTVHPPIGYYSHCVKAGNTIYTAGQVPVDLNGEIVGKGDFVAQFEQACENLRLVLEAAGATMADIVQTTWTVTDLSNLDGRIKEVFKKYFEAPYPAMVSTQSTLADPDLMIEMIATAVLD